MLGLCSRVGSAVPAVLSIHGTSAKSGLVVQTTLGVLAKVIHLRCPIPTERSLLRRSAILLALSSLLAELLAVVVVGISIGLVRGVVGGVIAGCGAESATRLLRLGSLSSEVVEGRLSRGSALLVEGVQWLLGGSDRLLDTSLAKSSVLLSTSRTLARNLSLRLRSWSCEMSAFKQQT